MLFVWFLTGDSSVGRVLVLEVLQSVPPRLAPVLSVLAASDRLLTF